MTIFPYPPLSLTAPLYAAEASFRGTVVLTLLIWLDDEESIFHSLLGCAFAVSSNGDQLEVADYKAGRLEKEVRDVDVVFDAVGSDTLEQSWGVLKPSGRIP